MLTDDHSVVDAGAGDDAIQVRSSSTVTGGAGNDSISVTGEGTTVNFANGDGNDVIDVNGHNVDLAISGYSLNDVILTQQYGKAIVNFKGSGDSLTFNLGGGGSVRLSFAGTQPGYQGLTQHLAERRPGHPRALQTTIKPWMTGNADNSGAVCARRTAMPR